MTVITFPILKFILFPIHDDKLMSGLIYKQYQMLQTFDQRLHLLFYIIFCISQESLVSKMLRLGISPLRFDRPIFYFSTLGYSYVFTKFISEFRPILQLLSHYFLLRYTYQLVALPILPFYQKTPTFMKFAVPEKVLPLLIQFVSEPNMEQITSVPGKLLYLTHKLFQQRKINPKEKGILKDLILSGSKEVTNVYEKYLLEGTELTLSSDLLHLLRLEKDCETEEASSQGSKKLKRNGITIKIPKRNIQKLPNIENRV